VYVFLHDISKTIEPLVTKFGTHDDRKDPNVGLIFFSLEVTRFESV